MYLPRKIRVNEKILLKNNLTPEQCHVLIEKGTERPFTGRYWNTKEDGTYHCAACGAPLFSSETKFDSGTGWPSFSDVAKSDAVKLNEDSREGMERVEVTCARCGGHLGHVFPDGPTATGKRYCINSACLLLKTKEDTGVKTGKNAAA